MIKLVLACLMVLLCPEIASADILLLETNDWDDQRHLVWTCILESIDVNTGVATFSYLNSSSKVTFKVHVTRIYSLEIDTQNRLDRAIPETQQDLITSLPTNPDSERILELSNKSGRVANTIPDDIFAWPNKHSLVVRLHGDIKEVDLPSLSIEAKNRSNSNQATSSFQIRRSDLLKWIR